MLQGDISYFGMAAVPLENLESLILSRNQRLTGSFDREHFCLPVQRRLTYLYVTFNEINGTIHACLLGPGASMATAVLCMPCLLIDA